jgi:hypothetical protein
MTRRPGWTSLSLSLILACTACLVLGPDARAEAAWSEAKLRAFATAAQAVERVAARWQPKFVAASSVETLQALTEQANAEMQAAIAATAGITQAEYDRIAAAAARDPALMAQIRGLLAGQP